MPGESTIDSHEFSQVSLSNLALLFSTGGIFAEQQHTHKKPLDKRFIALYT
jgi:hypothetical protein